MNRRELLKDGAIIMMGTPMLNLSGWVKKPAAALPGYLIPTLFDKSLHNYFVTYKRSSSDLESSTQLILNSLNKINSLPSAIRKNYSTHYDKVVQPILYTEDLGGLGVNGTNTSMRTRVFDEQQRPSTPLHSVSANLTDFDEDKWRTLGNRCELQGTLEDRVYLQATDDRPAKYKEVVWLPKVLDHLIYDPACYAYGLPIAPPNTIAIDESFRREVMAKTGKEIDPKLRYYNKQQWFFQPQDAAKEPQQKLTDIYWHHDQAIQEYYGLVQLAGCGNPTTPCTGSPASNNAPATAS
ncbi:hypothetical protein D3H65_11800 [Paraflavitalea soli]|uniref:Uncharacterized protein n=1 Tax=Paraflavitalea soli TaxID=2315862 RepID=A0A3B7MMU1_9BACT|nr:hypothetical protein [Paraflavitalea soli]AXY74623.1 hypothetical protein D3H65_11800 [Paraflavitalea soli]